MNNNVENRSYHFNLFFPYQLGKIRYPLDTASSLRVYFVLYGSCRQKYHSRLDAFLKKELAPFVTTVMEFVEF